MRMSGSEREREGALRIMEALSGVDEVLLERSEIGQEAQKRQGDSKQRIAEGRDSTRRKRGRRPIWQLGRTWAAVFCVAALGFMAWGGKRTLSNDASLAGSGEIPLVHSVYYAGDNQNTDSAGMLAEGEGAVADEVISENNGAGSGSVAGGNGMRTENGLDGSGMKPEGEPGGNGTKLENEPDGNGMKPDNTADGNGTESGNSEEIGNGAGQSGRKESDGTDNHAGRSDTSSGEDKEISWQICVGTTADQREKITEEEARAVEGLGGYIPAKLPEGYQFGEAYWNADSQCLAISWERGMDSIMLWLELAEEDKEVIDVSKPETYDVRLYEIPYGDSVPEEYREVFDDPVFAWEDFSKEIVESRIKSISDQGDTNTPRGNFSILFPEGVLVRFNGRGTPEQIWEMFNTKGL